MFAVVSHFFLFHRLPIVVNKPKKKHSIMGTFSLNFIPNASLVVLLGQASIPIAMVISKVRVNPDHHTHENSANRLISQYIFSLSSRSWFSAQNMRTTSTGEHLL